MATFEYVDIPSDAIRLTSFSKDSLAHSIRPATKILTSLPETAPQTTTSAPSSWRVQFDGINITPPSAAGTTANSFMSPTKSALSLVPQLLLSPPLPTSASSLVTPSAQPSTTGIISTAIATPNPRAPPFTLLSTRDSLSLPIMTTNFRRFVAKVGPVFWLQDRMEEVVLWKKGWRRTTVWLAAYAFLCYFPRMVLLIPHALLLGVMAAYYPEPGAPPVPIDVGEGTVDWQANIQAIQNLMGILSDVHDAILSFLPLLVPSQTPQSHSAPTPPSSTRNPPPPSSSTRSHLKPSSASTSTSTPLTTPSPSKLSSSSSSQHTVGPSSLPQPSTPYPQQPHHPLFLLTMISFFLLLPVLMADILPLRLLFFLAGVGFVGCAHPFVRGTFTARGGVKSLSNLSVSFSVCVPSLRFARASLTSPFSLLLCKLRRKPHSLIALPLNDTLTFSLTPKRIRMALRRLVDDDTLEDGVWAACMGEVELWENERWIGGGGTGRRSSLVFGDADAQGRDECAEGESDNAAGTGIGTERGTWSKANLRVGERAGWTRGRDGWSGVGGEVSSNLTFSLSPGWTFVETEGWRPDLEASWAVGDAMQISRTEMRTGTGADEDGWTYTTDTWSNPRADAWPGEGWVTRRRRWVRRVYWRGDG
ncbi:hypothetical protein PAXRUDRAFT_833805 [Paxillus rubicundulus Ve08.2h10]|uniref:Peroxin domain-containing protein n=1 Tax=Paxillus rubicundulus Ve08.2h10 TaxID=930991 RepID=A0A0D0CAX7_9AGAM|nr:hypothetical protein PAXRUDRAFT_833805 [Paxillus rubicundulus Ve08.2h10]